MTTFPSLDIQGVTLADKISGWEAWDILVKCSWPFNFTLKKELPNKLLEFILGLSLKTFISDRLSKLKMFIKLKLLFGFERQMCFLEQCCLDTE